MAAYHLFCGEIEYDRAAGGMDDYVGVFASVAEARAAVDQHADWANIAVLDEKTGILVTQWTYLRILRSPDLGRDHWMEVGSG